MKNASTTKNKKLKQLVFPLLFGVVLPQLTAATIVNFSNFKYSLPVLYVLSALFLLGTVKYCLSNGYLSHFSLKKVFKGIMGGVLMLGFGLVFSLLASKVGVDAPDGLADIYKHMNIMFLFLTLFGPIWEEVIFRGIINDRFFGNSPFGIVISSILFSLYHGIFSLFLVLYFGAGVIFSLANRNEDDITASIVAHIFYNTGIVVLGLVMGG
ncbi:CPBP family intramembrane glutamic endopeptidase [Xylocopilactobacillus apis]|uniref:Protease n=1 Tax=Xylocopilactobacillus apis TaxID=2932183 RepID=A0AAU9D3F5_9LACO|nr:type II CAAX endopeptidase family protein [Xylocopilactobacillus apis]BDR57071.1 protease [Xylocopilactobacillus apis]